MLSHKTSRPQIVINVHAVIVMRAGHAAACTLAFASARCVLVVSKCFEFAAPTGRISQNTSRSFSSEYSRLKVEIGIRRNP